MAREQSAVHGCLALASAEQDESADAFAEELVRIRPALRSRALFFTQSGAAADDLLQETLLRALTNRHLFQPGTSLSAWMGSIMRHLFIDQCRRPCHVHGVDALADAVSPDQNTFGPLDFLDSADVRSAAATLDPDERELYEAAYFQGMSYRDLARRLGVCANTIGSRLHRTKAKLRRILEKIHAARRRALDA